MTSDQQPVRAQQRLARFEQDHNFAIDVLHDRIQWSIWADADRKDVVDAVDGMNEGTCWDGKVVALVAVPRGISNQDAQEAVNAAFLTPQPVQADGLREAERRALIAELQPLADKAAGPNGWDWMFPIRVVPVDGKPTITSHKGGNLFRGYIATWQEADLLVALANAAPRILAALAQPAPAPSDADLRGLVEPWADHHGPLPDYDHPLSCVFDSGVQYAVELLAKELGVEDWTPCDGSEEYDGDLGGTMINIVCASLPTDEHGERMFPRDVHARLSSAPDALREAERRGEQRAIDRIVNAAHAIGWQAGVGGRETAGAIASYLATSPDEIEPFIAGTLSPLDFVGDWMRGGCLTWHGANGQIVSPAALAAHPQSSEAGEG